VILLAVVKGSIPPPPTTTTGTTITHLHYLHLIRGQPSIQYRFSTSPLDSFIQTTTTTTLVFDYTPLDIEADVITTW